MQKAVWARDTRNRLRKRAKQENGCWLWPSKLKNGYGFISARHVAKTRLVHRIAYIVFVGPIKAGYEIDHLCRVRNCINPKHLEAVSRKINRDRQTNAMVACRNGHPYTEESTYWRSDGGRNCRVCGMLNAQKYRKGF